VDATFGAACVPSVREGVSQHDSKRFRNAYFAG
jgi:hypothetical protein